MNRQRSALPLMAAIGATVCWGAGTTLSKLALGYFDPSLLLVVQLLASLVFLLALLPFARVRVDSWRVLSRISLLGILEPGLAYFLGLEGLQRIGAAEAVVLSSTESILVVLLAWALALARPRGSVLALAMVGAAGAVMVTGVHFEQGNANSLWGDALLLGGVLSAAGYVVWSSRLASQIEPLPALIGQQVVAVLLALLFHLAVNDQPLSVVPVPVSGWGLAVLSGIIQYACAFWLYLWALKGLRADVAGLYLSLIPVFGLAIAIPVLRERLSAIQWLGSLLIIGTLVVLARLDDGYHEREGQLA